MRPALGHDRRVQDKGRIAEASLELESCELTSLVAIGVHDEIVAVDLNESSRRGYGNKGF